MTKLVTAAPLETAAPLVAAPTTRLRVAILGGSLALFLALAVAQTWPLAKAPGTLSRNDNGDTVLHEWIMAWVVHQAVRDPVHLFDANIFYPERRTLAYSDPLIVESAMAAPLLLAGASPVLAYNVVLILGFALTGWTTCLVVQHWTGSWLAGILSGSLMAFNSFTLTVLPQIQLLHLEFFPLTLLALDRLLAVPRVGHALQLAGWYVLQALTGNYLLVFTAISLVAATVARPRAWIGSTFRVCAPQLALAGALATAALIPLLVPYQLVRHDVGLVRSLAGAATYGAVWTDYLAAAGTWHLEHWSRAFLRASTLFPGATALVLVLTSIGTGIAVKDGRARMALAIGSVALALSFGPKYPLYRWMYEVFPLMSGIRAVDRFGEIVLASLAILAGFGFAAIRPWFHPRQALIAGLFLVVAVNAEAWRAPFPYTPYRGIPPVYRSLASASDHAVVVAFPFYGSTNNFLNTNLMLASTTFWKPMLNGYSGWNPPSFYEHVDQLNGFPDRRSIDYLRSLGVTHVVVRWWPEQVATLAAFPELRLWTTDGEIRIYLLADKS
jgi:hypothetical protein